MARYSPIAPIALLEQMHELEVAWRQRVLGNYLLLLTHDVLNYPARYAELMHSVRRRYKASGDTFIIMDNSVIEMGAPMPMNDVLDAASIVDADCVMSPDMIGDFLETKKLVMASSGLLKYVGCKVMLVPQGKTQSEVSHCIQWMYDYMEGAAYWGVPRWIANKIGSRMHCIEAIKEVDPAAQIHLLGMSMNHQDDMRCAKVEGVMGIDSANPVVAGYRGLDVETDNWVHLDRGTYWNEMRLTSLAVSNIKLIHDVLSS